MTPQEAARAIETCVRSYYVRDMEITLHNQTLEVEEVCVDTKTSTLHVTVTKPRVPADDKKP